MGNIVGLDLNIDNDYLTEAVKQTVVMGISESLNGKNEIVSQLVSSVLNTKVNERGEISSYSRDNKYTLLELYVRKAIKDVAREEITNAIENSRPQIAELVRKEISKKSTQGDIVSAFIDSLVKNIENQYRTSISVSFDKREDY